MYGSQTMNLHPTFFASITLLLAMQMNIGVIFDQKIMSSIIITKQSLISNTKTHFLLMIKIIKKGPKMILNFLRASFFSNPTKESFVNYEYEYKIRPMIKRNKIKNKNPKDK